MRDSIIDGRPLPESYEEFNGLLGTFQLRSIQCTSCLQLYSRRNTRSAAGWRETQINAMCEDCFDRMFSEGEETTPSEEFGLSPYHDYTDADLRKHRKNRE